MDALIPLQRRDGTIVGYATVDLVDAHQGEHVWRLNVRHNRAYRKVQTRNVYLHRAILGLEFGDQRQGDHINRDRLDNRRSNLRIVTHAQNGQNVSSQVGSTSRFRGVSWDRLRGKWAAYAKVGGRNRNVGRFESELDAAAAASEFRSRHMTHAVESA